MNWRYNSLSANHLDFISLYLIMKGICERELMVSNSENQWSCPRVFSPVLVLCLVTPFLPGPGPHRSQTQTWPHRLLLLFLFLMGTIYFSLYGMSYNIASFFYIFWPPGMWDLSSPTRDRTHSPCIGRSLNHWITRKVPRCHLNAT